MRLLIVEDNKRIAQALKDALDSYYTVDLEYSGKEALNNLNIAHYDAILLDLGLPDMEGKEVCRRLRTRGINSPVIVLTGDDSSESKIDLLDYGADDYMTKPVRMGELKARIRAVMRRRDHRPGRKGAVTLLVGDLELDPANRTVARQGKSIILRRKEFDLLEYMMRNHDQTLTRKMIVTHVWERGDGVWTNSVDVQVKFLRDKIDRPYGSHMIKTIHGVGYKLEADVPKGGSD